jgi:hypothetical protein
MTKLIRKKLLAAVSIPVFAVAMVSCSAEGGFTEAPIIINESAEGIYAGTFTSTAGAEPVDYEVTGIISRAHVGQFIVADSDRHYSTKLNVIGSDLFGTLTQYRGVQDRFFGIDGIDSIEFDGRVSESDTIAADYSGENDEGSLALAYDPSYETESSLDKTSGIWTYVGAVGYTVTLTIELNGEIFGSDTNGCVYSGLISILDKDYGIYRAVVLVTDCGPVNDEYNGFAILSDTLTISVSNDVIAFVPVLDKT